VQRSNLGATRLNPGRNTWRNAAAILGATLAQHGGFGTTVFFPPPSGDELPSRVEDELPPPGEIGGGEKALFPTGIEHRNRRDTPIAMTTAAMPLPTSSDH